MRYLSLFIFILAFNQVNFALAEHSTIQTFARTLGYGCLSSPDVGVGKITMMTDYSNCTADELSTIETKLSEAMDKVRSKLLRFATNGKFSRMTQASDASRYALLKATLAQVQLTHKKALVGIKNGCLSKDEIKDPGSVALFSFYESCSVDELKAMAKLMLDSMTQDLPRVKPYAEKDFHHFTQAGATSRLAIAKSSLVLILKRMREKDAEEYKKWMKAIPTYHKTNDLNNPGTVASIPSYGGFTTGELQGAKRVAMGSSKISANKLTPYATKNFYNFTESSKTVRLALMKSAIAHINLEQLD